MLRKAGLLCAALAMFSIAGGHWAVLQSVAWGRMLADYARATGSVVTAVEQTFDGEHPCSLCQRIAAAKGRAESSPPASSPAAADPKFKPAKTDGVLAENDFLPRLTVPAAVGWPVPAPADPRSRAERPPVPPPRSTALA